MIEVRRRELVQPTLLTYFTLTCCAGANLIPISFGGSPSNLLLMQNLHVKYSLLRQKLLRCVMIYSGKMMFASLRYCLINLLLEMEYSWHHLYNDESPVFESAEVRARFQRHGSTKGLNDGNVEEHQGNKDIHRRAGCLTTFRNLHQATLEADPETS